MVGVVGIAVVQNKKFVVVREFLVDKLTNTS
jgi:hypothetical protein